MVLSTEKIETSNLAQGHKHTGRRLRSGTPNFNFDSVVYHESCAFLLHNVGVNLGGGRYYLPVNTRPFLMQILHPMTLFFIAVQTQRPPFF